MARDVAVLNQTELNAPEIVPVEATINDVLPIRLTLRMPARAISVAW